MSALLARLLKLGLAKEATPGTWLAPVRSIPVLAPKPEDLTAELRDESFKGNDVILQGIYGGPITSAIGYQIPHLYPDVLGDHLRAIVGPDTLTAGISTTLSATTVAGATAITTAVSIPSGSTIQIDTAGVQEWFVSGTPTGVGPFTIPVTTGMGAGGNSLKYGHTSGVAVISQSTHSFAQDHRAAPVPTYSLTQANTVDLRGYAGCVESDLAINIDPKAAITADASWLGFPSAVVAGPSAPFSTVQPMLGWQWGLTVGGVASTRGLSAAYKLKRACEPIQASNGLQTPREFFADSIECDVKMKAIFENTTDFTQFTGYSYAALVSTLTQPLSQGGSVLTITNTGQKYIKFAGDYGSKYLQADIDASAAMNTTDNGIGTVTLKNYVGVAY